MCSIEENWAQGKINASCFLLPIEKIIIIVEKDIEAAKKNGAGGDEKHLFVCLLGHFNFE